MATETQTIEAPVDILSESDISYEYASRGQRFLNYLIDNVLMKYGLSFLTGMLLAIVFEVISLEFMERMLIEGTTEFWVFAFITGFLNYVLYYTICEKLFNGYTLGKLITGTKAVRIDGSPLRFKDALLRSLSRMVPFEPLSGFGTPLARLLDKYYGNQNQVSSKTCAVKKLKRRLGLPPFGIIGIPFTVKGTQDNPIVKLKRDKDGKLLEETDEKEKEEGDNE